MVTGKQGSIAPLQKRPPPFNGRGPFRLSGGLTVNPRVHVAFLPPQVLADPVRRQLPSAPVLADGPLGNSQNRGYLAR
jgi:hypothetical protein